MFLYFSSTKIMFLQKLLLLNLVLVLIDSELGFGLYGKLQVLKIIQNVGG